MYNRRVELIGRRAFLGDSHVDYEHENPLFSYSVDKLKDVHTLDDFLANPHCLKRFLIRDLYRLHHAQTGKFIGPCLSKSAQVIARFDKETNSLFIGGVKTYSRRSESKERTYPVEWVAKRLTWFLDNSPFVNAYKIRQSGLNYEFAIDFVSCYSEDRIKVIKKRRCLENRTAANLEIVKLQYAIENYDTLENLQKRLAKAVKQRDNAQRQFDAIK